MSQTQWWRDKDYCPVTACPTCLYLPSYATTVGHPTPSGGRWGKGDPWWGGGVTRGGVGGWPIVEGLGVDSWWGDDPSLGGGGWPVVGLGVDSWWDGGDPSLGGLTRGGVGGWHVVGLGVDPWWRGGWPVVCVGVGGGGVTRRGMGGEPWWWLGGRPDVGVGVDPWWESTSWRVQMRWRLSRDGQCACQPSRSPEAFTDVWPSLAASSSLINSTRCSLHDCKRAWLISAAGLHAFGVWLVANCKQSFTAS